MTLLSVWGNRWHHVEEHIKRSTAKEIAQCFWMKVHIPLGAQRLMNSTREAHAVLYSKILKQIVVSNKLTTLLRRPSTINLSLGFRTFIWSVWFFSGPILAIREIQAEKSETPNSTPALNGCWTWNNGKIYRYDFGLHWFWLSTRAKLILTQFVLYIRCSLMAQD